MKYQVISADNYIIDPRDLYTERLPTEYRDPALHEWFRTGFHEWFRTGFKERADPLASAEELTTERVNRCINGQPFGSRSEASAAADEFVASVRDAVRWLADHPVADAIVNDAFWEGFRRLWGGGHRLRCHERLSPPS